LIEDTWEPISYVSNPRTGEIEQIQPPTIISQSISELLVSSVDDQARFEVGIANSTGATIPAVGAKTTPFENWALHAGYQFDEQNIAGLHFEYGLFNTHMISISQDATLYTGAQQAIWMPVYGAYYEHRERIGRGGFLIAGIVGAGLFDAGNYMSLGLGGRLPLGDHFMAGATVSLTRKHDGGITKDEILSNNEDPIIFEGSDIHNTLITRIEYGLSYRF
jgi:hypothetical protein